MPRIGERMKGQLEIEAAIAEREAFAAEFRRSRKGNLWRTYDGRTVVVFQREADGCFAWSINGGDDVGTQFSESAYEIECDAMESLMDVLDVGAI